MHNLAQRSVIVGRELSLPVKTVVPYNFQFSFRGDYINALVHYEKGITKDNKVIPF